MPTKDLIYSVLMNQRTLDDYGVEHTDCQEEVIPEGPCTQYLGILVLGIVIIGQVLGKYMIIRYLDP